MCLQAAAEAEAAAEEGAAVILGEVAKKARAVEEEVPSKEASAVAAVEGAVMVGAENPCQTGSVVVPVPAVNLVQLATAGEERCPEMLAAHPARPSFSSE